ncbi:hypothetical protein FHS91_001286 [Sphingobium xanthum]|uniref:hypothetical protein n=1 Tax=Sphingobium xanthum TaxID=1387165 RepID=UPI001FE58AE6|nr:hypothetical protein [Sphingobium xanthum]
MLSRPARRRTYLLLGRFRLTRTTATARLGRGLHDFLGRCVARRLVIDLDAADRGRKARQADVAIGVIIVVGEILLLPILAAFATITVVGATVVATAVIATLAAIRTLAPTTTAVTIATIVTIAVVVTVAARALLVLLLGLRRELVRLVAGVDHVIGIVAAVLIAFIVAAEALLMLFLP